MEKGLQFKNLKSKMGNILGRKSYKDFCQKIVTKIATNINNAPWWQINSTTQKMVKYPITATRKWTTGFLKLLERFFLDHIFSFLGVGDSRNVLQKISNISDMDRP